MQIWGESMILSENWVASIDDHAGHSFTVPATVPGCIHTDLQRAGILPDLFYRDNSKLCQWVENCDVTYTCTFTLQKTEPDMWFNFRGIDVYCSVFCNGIHLGDTDDMHIPWLFSAKQSLRAGKNVLVVRFRSPIKETLGMPKRSGAFTCERMWTRRIQCSYGWDWVDRFVTMGLWREVSLEVRKPDTFVYENESIYIYTNELTPYAAQVAVELNFAEITGSAWVSMQLTDPDGNVIWNKRRRILQ